MSKRGTRQCVHLYGNHKAYEKGDCQDGLEGAGRPVAGGQYSSHKQCLGSSARAAVLRECRRWWEERLVESSEG